MAITREFVRAVRGRLAEVPGLSTGWLAVELGAREADVLTCLPVAMRRRARLEDRAAICGLLADLGLPPGPGVNDAPGREVGSIWFVADSPAGAEAQTPGSVRFMDKGGDLLCLVRLNGEFGLLWQHFGVKDVPPKKRCCGGRPTLGDAVCAGSATSDKAHSRNHVCANISAPQERKEDVPPKKRCCKSGGKSHCGNCRCRRGLPCCGGGCKS